MYEISVILLKSSGGWQDLIHLYKTTLRASPRTGGMASPFPSVWATLSDLLPVCAQAGAVNSV